MTEGNNYKIDDVEFHLRLKKPTSEVKMFLKHVLKSSRKFSCEKDSNF